MYSTASVSGVTIPNNTKSAVVASLGSERTLSFCGNSQHIYVSGTSHTQQTEPEPQPETNQIKRTYYTQQEEEEEEPSPKKRSKGKLSSVLVEHDKTSFSGINNSEIHPFDAQIKVRSENNSFSFVNNSEIGTKGALSSLGNGSDSKLVVRSNESSASIASNIQLDDESDIQVVSYENSISIVQGAKVGSNARLLTKAENGTTAFTSNIELAPGAQSVCASGISDLEARAMINWWNN